MPGLARVATEVVLAIIAEFIVLGDTITTAWSEPCTFIVAAGVERIGVGVVLAIVTGFAELALAVAAVGGIAHAVGAADLA